MAKQKFLYDSGNGLSNEVANSGSDPVAYFDNTTNAVVINNLTISSVTSSLAAGIVTASAAGILGTLSTSSVPSGQYLQSDGTKWIFATASNTISGNFGAGSDLSGSVINPSVINVSNVNTGTLSALYGGTGVTSFTSGGILVKDNTGTLKFITPDANLSVLRPTGSGWYSGGASNSGGPNPVSQSYFVCSSSNKTSTYTWTKPANTYKNIRLVMMGGGGAGGSSTATYVRGGTAGAFSVNDFYCPEELTASIQIGAGGTGSAGTNGQPGFSTFFSASSSKKLYYYLANGGVAGTSTSNAGAAYADNQPGNISSRNNFQMPQHQSYFGYVGGGTTNGSAGTSLYGSGAGGSKGGLAAGNLGGVGGNKQLTNRLTASIASTTLTTFGTAQYPIYIGGGGSIGSPGSPGISGSGGGASNVSTSPLTAGGSGGDGYMLIIAW